MLSETTTKFQKPLKEGSCDRVMSLASLIWCGLSDCNMEIGYSLTHHRTSLGADGFCNEIRNCNHHTDDKLILNE